MSFESLLQFWTVHNRQIIEFVFVSTFVLVLFVIYRQFFSKSESQAVAGSSANPVSIDTSEIEEKLKKILENQGAFKSAEPTGSGPTSISDTNGGSNNAELEKLRVDLKEKEKMIEDIRKNATSTPAVGAGKEEDVKKLEDKIKELEGRLSEYEIISEDIADLSFYKEENTRLQKEIAAGSKAVPPSAPAIATPAVAIPEPEVAKVEPRPSAVAEQPIVPTAVTPTATVATTPAAVGAKPAVDLAAAAADSIVDDDILKEFAAAVEGQKTAEKEAGPAPQPTDVQKLTESKELMGEFENFIKKG